MSDDQDNDQGQQQSQDDQANDQSKNDQGADDNSNSGDQGDDQNDNQEQTVEIDGEEVPIEELKKGYMRGKDYTHKTQQLADAQRKAGEKESTVNIDLNDPEAQKALKTLKGLGLITKDDLDTSFSKFQVSQKQQQRLDGIVDRNPDLKPFKKAIETLGKQTGEAWEDIITNYGFAKKNSLQRAKASGEIKGSIKSKTQHEAKKVENMTDAEYEVWRKDNLGKSSRFTRLTK